MTLYHWSHTPSDNATADPTVGYAEGQAPSTLNDSARAAMAAIAKFRDDVSGSITTDVSGTSTAYYVFSNQAFDTLAHLNNQVIAFTPNLTNGDGPLTLNVDSLGGKPLRSARNTEIPKGVLLAGTPYTAIYNNTDGAFYLAGYYISPSLVPVGASVDYWGSTLPNSQFAFMAGQTLSRATYATLFAITGTTYGTGAGDGLTFSLPDLRGRVTAGPDNMGGTDSNRLNSTASNIVGVRTTLGGAGGEVAHTLLPTEIPTITSAGSASVNTAANNVVTGTPTTTLTSGGSGAQFQALNQGSGASGALNSNGTATVSSNNTGGLAHNVMQPTILCNKIIRVL